MSQDNLTLVALASTERVPAGTVEGLDHAFGEALGRHVADPSPSVLLAKAPGLMSPPMSPNWYRKKHAAPPDKP